MLLLRIIWNNVAVCGEDVLTKVNWGSLKSLNMKSPLLPTLIAAQIAAYSAHIMPHSAKASRVVQPKSRRKHRRRRRKITFLGFGPMIPLLMNKISIFSRNFLRPFKLFHPWKCWSWSESSPFHSLFMQKAS